MIAEPTLPPLTIRAVRSIGVEVPMTYALGTSQARITRAPLLLIDLETEEGITGRAYLFCYLGAAAPAMAAMLDEIGHMVTGDPVVPAQLWGKLAQRFMLIGVQGVVRMAMAGLDVAAWDALAIAAGVPLATFLGAKSVGGKSVGGKPQPVRAYNSCGLGLMAPAEVADESEKLLARGFRAVKLRLGYPTLKEDLAAVHAVRRRIGDDVDLMVDYNQALSVPDALERGRALDAENIYWIEEPIRHDDYAGCASLAQALTTPVQIGENFSLPVAMETALKANAADYVMPDLERIGGVTGWRQAAVLAAEHRIKMSSHLFPEVSAHLLAATPTCHFLEYMDWADALVQEPLRIVDGHAVIPERPGNGLVWDQAKVARFRM
jgi:mandelate racemase